MRRKYSKTGAERRAAERRAWDQKIAQSDVGQTSIAKDLPDLRTVYDSILSSIGGVEGKSVLDCGCGEGFLTREAAAAGARVYGIDISVESLIKARSLSDPKRHDISYICSAFEQLPFEDESFDAVMGMLVLHHVDLGVSAREIARVLKPGGRGCFVETWMLNPLIRAARRFRGRIGIAQWGTEDERPLLPADLDPIRKAGLEVEVSYPGFVFLSLIDRNVLRERWRPTTRILHAADRMLAKIPAIRRYGYYCIVQVKRPA